MMDDKHRKRFITPRELTNELLLIPEAHRDKPICSISSIGNRTKNVMSILIHPFGEVKWTIDDDGCIALDFVAEDK